MLSLLETYVLIWKRDMMAQAGEQLQLPLEPADHGRPAQIGGCAVEYRPARSILTRSTGFIDAFDFTLNPSSGCSFGCSYCYAAAFVRDQQRRASWGQWVQVKENALELLRKRRRAPLEGVTIYLSSVTDPYQPIERRLQLTRSILEELVTFHQVGLVVQTRGPLVTRDIDLLRQFATARVNMTVTTDDDAVRRAFEPGCASVGRRLAAIAEVHAAGISTCVTMTPLLPVSDPAGFAERLKATGVTRFVAQYLHAERGQFAAGTRAPAVALSQAWNWDVAAYRRTFELLRAALPGLTEGRDGFRP
jgi:DNA repair photolyase